VDSASSESDSPCSSLGRPGASAVCIRRSELLGAICLLSSERVSGSTRPCLLACSPTLPISLAEGERRVTSKQRILRYQGVEVVEDQGTARSLATTANRIVIVKRGGLRWVVFRCPCGCGDLLTVNVDRRVPPNWRVIHRGKSVTLMPSVWRTSGCRSHFILWKSQVWLFRNWDRDEDVGPLPETAEKELRLEWWRVLSERQRTGEGR
jgi:uncharacterized protein DUF6527